MDLDILDMAGWKEETLRVAKRKRTSMGIGAILQKRITPYQILVLGYLFIALLGGLLLSLPIATTQAGGQSYLDALFLSMSGLSTTGLSVVDVGSFYSLFGQIVLLCIFQIGGIGYMTIIILVMYSLGLKGSIRTSIVARDSLVGSDFHTMKKFFVSVIAYSLLFELAGGIVLALFWMREYPVARALYLGMFHSISAFCTAGFGLFSDSLMRYGHSAVVNIAVIVLSLAGGIGFFVLKDLQAYGFNNLRSRRKHRLAVHTRLVIVTTAILITFGTLSILLFEDWPSSASRGESGYLALFQAISASTTDGFNTIDIGAMSAASLTVIMLLMFVGASPGSTGGGIKTTTFALLFFVLWAKLRRREVNVFGREMSEQCVYNAIIVAVFFMLVVFIDTIILSATMKAPYINIVFEIISALGNTGLSMGLTSSLNAAGKAALIATMFIGRVGFLSIAFALLTREQKALYRFPKEDIFIG
ncbi:MAG: Trk family potassium uptake protein [Candidatus Krumholzibacteria bacterium]|nr:Trk family potassium uptake protein [Candidatus Krumholzibacteria bacterium]